MPLDVKTAVADAFQELLARKDVDKITVKDLVEACGISRQTFYYHFRDIVDVMEWKARREMERLLPEHLKAASPREAMGRFVDFAEYAIDFAGQAVRGALAAALTAMDQQMSCEEERKERPV